MMLMLVVMVMMMVALAMGIVARLVMVMMVMLMVMVHLLHHLLSHGHLLDGGEDGLAVQLIPRSGDNGGIAVLLTEQGNRRLQLLLRQLLGAGQDNGACGLDLIVIELTEVLHEDLHLHAVRHGGVAVEAHVGLLRHRLFHRCDYVAELTHAGGLNEDTVGGELLLHVLQRRGKVAHQGAADAAGGHLRHLHAALLQKAAVDADLAELIFNEHQLLAFEGLLQQLLNEGGLTCTQEAGNNINFCHS